MKAAQGMISKKTTTDRIFIPLLSHAIYVQAVNIPNSGELITDSPSCIRYGVILEYHINWCRCVGVPIEQHTVRIRAS